MTDTISIREYGILQNDGKPDGLDRQIISSSAFNYLIENGTSNSENERELIRVRRKKGKVVLQVVNFVGVLDTPCGTRIEIVPKTSTEETEVEVLRQLLMKMLMTVYNIPIESFNQSNLKTSKRPLFEILISQFLKSVSKLVKRGIRSDYSRVQKESPFLKGQLLVAKQIRQRPGRETVFHIEYDVYLPNRPENRLIHSAILQVMKWSKLSSNQRLARELTFVFADIEKSSNYELDISRWRNDRSLIHYRPLKSWCILILRQETPLSLAGKRSGISFLFPMEVLFERYVAKKLSSQLPPRYQLKEQAKSKYLTEHNGDNWFQLRPDILILEGKQTILVMDTKWKLVDQNKSSSKDKYGLSQADFYQLYAYGQKYLNGVGLMYLIYPAWEKFDTELPPFNIDKDLSLNVVPFDLNSDCLVTGQCQVLIPHFSPVLSENSYHKQSSG